MMHDLLHILLILIPVVFFLILFSKLFKLEKLFGSMSIFLDKNMEILNRAYRVRVAEELKKSLSILIKFQIIQKISKSNYLTFYKYNYSQKYIELDFDFSIRDGVLVDNTPFEKILLSGDILTLDFFKKINCEFCELNIDELEFCEKGIYQSIKDGNITKIYYKHIFNKNDKYNPVAIVFMSYKDCDFELVDDEKSEIIRILKNISFDNLPKNIDTDLIKPTKKEVIKESKNFDKKLIFSFILIFSFFIGSLHINNSFHNTKNIYDTYFDYYDGPGNMRGLVENTYEIGMIKFNDKNYKDALEIFESVILLGGENSTVYFFAGLSSLFLEMSDKALSYFSLCEEDSSLYEDVEWYTAGSYILGDNVKEAKIVLEKIANSDSYYNETSSKILKKNLFK